MSTPFNYATTEAWEQARYEAKLTAESAVKYAEDLERAWESRSAQPAPGPYSYKARGEYYCVLDSRGVIIAECLPRLEETAALLAASWSLREALRALLPLAQHGAHCPATVSSELGPCTCGYENAVREMMG